MLTRWVICSWVAALGNAPCLLVSHLAEIDCLHPGRPTSWTVLLQQPEQLLSVRLNFEALLHEHNDSLGTRTHRGANVQDGGDKFVRNYLLRDAQCKQQAQDLISAIWLHSHET